MGTKLSKAVIYRESLPPSGHVTLFWTNDINF